MLNSPELMSCLRSWGRGSPLCNMHIERLLVLIKCASPTCKHKPTVEKVLANGFNTQVMTDHIHHGGSDPRRTTREELLSLGVPLECKQQDTPVKRPISNAMSWSKKLLRRRLGASIAMSQRCQKASATLSVAMNRGHGGLERKSTTLLPPNMFPRDSPTLPFPGPLFVDLQEM